MARCQILAEVGRRQFLKGSGVAAAGAVAGAAVGAAGRPRHARAGADHLSRRAGSPTSPT